jgi:choline dehydrogenase
MFIAEAGLFTRTRNNMKAASPDLQFHFSAGLPAFAPPGLTGAWYGFVPILVRPQSVGFVDIASRDPLDPGYIRANYLQMQADMDVLLRGVELSREIAHTRAFAEFGSEEAGPGIHKSKRELSEYIRTHCSTVWHVSGTCMMGCGPMAVVDPQLRVYGVDGLRVADASIMPTVVAGNTNAACIMIGEKLADMVLSERNR